jgi:hypothetical protein
MTHVVPAFTRSLAWPLSAMRACLHRHDIGSEKSIWANRRHRLSSNPHIAIREVANLDRTKTRHYLNNPNQLTRA